MSTPPASEPLIALVDDDASMLYAARVLLRSAGFSNIAVLEDSRAILPMLETTDVAVVVLDLVMPHIGGDRLLPQIVHRHPETPVIIMTATDEVATAVECIKGGAFDFLVKPVDENRFVSCLRKALEWRDLRRQVGALKRSLLTGRLEHEAAFVPIVTGHPKMRALFQYMESIAGTNEPVLITGETGVGKELIAEALHRVSGRGGELVPVNVAGLDDALFSDTLFGHKKGAYSGAEENRTGLIARAGQGSLFLDEIGDLGHASQVKLLRLLQERKYYPLGSDVPRVSDARILCATNRDPDKMMVDGHFRSDLYFRLQVHRIEIPPLRERPEDIPLLADHFLREAAREMRKEVPEPSEEIYDLLEACRFPGNVRQLRALIYDAVARAHQGHLPLEPFRQAAKSAPGPSRSVFRLAGEGSGGLFRNVAGRLPTLQEAEQELVEEAMTRAKGNQGVAAGFLGISRQALNQRLKKKREEPDLS
ncbi:MAG: sigma-54-dependent Fis family transcriptional regulator [Magnetococcales bacterium]|nr:sigma-54-dependent Fis family transcriptional regulator [Magnetococcales bacterium]